MAVPIDIMHQELGIRPVNTPDALSDFQKGFLPREEPYVFFPEWVEDFMAWFSQEGFREPLWIDGPSGAGKSSFVNQMLARLKVPRIRLSGHGQIEIGDLLGETGAVGGSTYYLDGPLPQAMENNMVLVLDEADTLSPSVLTCLHAVLEGEPLYLPHGGGRLVHPGPNFSLIVTANSKGKGEQRAAHRGTQTMSLAFLNRFWKMTMTYLPESWEASIVRTATNLPAAITDKMVGVASDVRAAYAADLISFTLSPRELIRWGHLTRKKKVLLKDGKNPYFEASKLAFLNGATSASDNEAFTGFLVARGLMKA